MEGTDKCGVGNCVTSLSVTLGTCQQKASKAPDHRRSIADRLHLGEM